jgi:hypothetical protein
VGCLGFPFITSLSLRFQNGTFHENISFKIICFNMAAVSLLLLSGRRGISAGEKLSLDVTDPLAATHHYLLKFHALIILLKR